MKKYVPVLVVLILLASSVALARSPIDNVIILPVNEPLTVRCQGGDELQATVWAGGQWELVCREYVILGEVVPVPTE